MSEVLILRPRPGADETAERARALGLVPVEVPLFTVRPLAWEAPDPGEFEAAMLTSANAARVGGAGLQPFFALPCYCVGEATAAAAHEAGFSDVRTGPDDGAGLLAMMAADGVDAAFHPRGSEHGELHHPQVRVVAQAVYAADAASRLPARAEAALRNGTVALLHSPRAAALFDRLVRTDRSSVAVAAISPATAAAAGRGWRAVAVAERPRDSALLELAAKLCQTAAR